MPARAGWPTQPLPATRLKQTLLLALLLHVLLVLVLGNRPGGSARPGEGGFGSLRVTLSGGPPQPGALMMPGGPSEAQPGPQGRARQARVGGTVRPEADSRIEDDAPGAVRLGRWRAQPLERGDGAAPPAVPGLEPLPELALPPMPAEPRLDVAPAPRTLSDLVPAPLSRLQDAPLQRSVVPSEALESGQLPRPPQLLRQLQAPELARALLQPVQGLPALRDAELAPAPAAPALPTRLPTAPAQSAERLKPAPPVTAARTVEALPALALPELSLPQASAQAPAMAASESLAPAPQGRAVTSTLPVPEQSSSSPSARPALGPAGSPEAGERLGHDIATPPALPPDGPRPRLDLSLPRGAAASSRSTPGVLQLLPRPPERKSQLEQELGKAAREDCRRAHADAGLLAVVPLVVDAARGKGCRW